MTICSQERRPCGLWPFSPAWPANPRPIDESMEACNMYVCMYVCMYIYIHILYDIYMYILSCKKTYIHTYIICMIVYIYIEYVYIYIINHIKLIMYPMISHHIPWYVPFYNPSHVHSGAGSCFGAWGRPRQQPPFRDTAIPLGPLGPTLIPMWLSRAGYVCCK